MTRPMCRLCGMEFPLPIQLDEVPMQRTGSDQRYHVADTHAVSASSTRDAVSNWTDRNRGMTREHAATNRMHWSTEAAEQQYTAIQNAVKVFKKKNRVLDIPAALKHCVENADGTTDVQTDGGEIPPTTDA